MKKIESILLIIIVVFLGCKQKAETKEVNGSGTDKNEKALQPTEGLEDLKVWTNAVNVKENDKIEASYAANAIKIISADSILEGSRQIANFYTAQDDKITLVESLFKTKANKNLKIHYELIRFKTGKVEDYIQLIIWRIEGGKKLRELEFSIKSDATSLSFENEIAERRALWMELCNDHNPENLVTQLYSRDALYFNHKPLVKGTENLVKEYAYMNNPEYHLTLDPLKVETVTQDLMFEIGQCSGSYQGKYILIWKKESDGVWKIFFDSNV